MLQYLDFSHASTSRKWTNRRQGDGTGTHGFEAPRNSMEFPMEVPHSYGIFQEDLPYSCNMRQYPRTGLNHSSATNPIKKLIQEDISFRTNEGQKRPSVIARLMGMDSPPLNTARTELITGHSEGTRQEIIARPMPRRDPAEITSAKHVSFLEHDESIVRHAAKKEIRAYGDADSELFGQLAMKSSTDQWSSRPQPREHPQEEELQRFKKEFEAWQASRLWEHSRALELESNLDGGGGGHDRCTDMVPYRYKQRRRHGNGGKLTRCNDDAQWQRRRSRESGTSISGSRTFSLTSAESSSASARLPLSRFYHEEERSVSLSPTRIVILKPCPELSADDVEESSLGSPELAKKENNMEAFLEEVKKRLKIELEGRISSDDHRAAADRWPACDDVPADPKQIAKSIANQIRETVTKDLHPAAALVRSESTRSYRGGDVPINGQSQMDYICRDARKQLSDRLKNVLRREPEAADQPQLPRRRRAASTSFDDEPRPKPRQDMVARKGKIRSKEEKKRAIESDARSFGHGHNGSVPAIDYDDPVSPRNLIRSFSAPVSGTTFVKLLSEEPRVLTGARLQRKHEGHGHGSRPPSSEERKGRKDAFSIKGRVSNLRQNLGLRGKLFGKKLHSAADESSSSFPDDLPPIGTLLTAPSVLIHPGVLQENSTEVPPSPASWCSSPPDEMSRGGYPSPVSPLEASFSEHGSSLKAAAKDVSSSASERGNLPEQVQVEEHAETRHAQEEEEEEDDDDGDDTVEMDHPMKSFIRAVLVVAGLYGRSRSSGNVFSDGEVKPIPRWVCEKVGSPSSSPASSVPAADHPLLFDLINEALPRVVQDSTTLCTFSKWHAAPPAAAPRRAPSGRRLLDGLWKSVQAWAEAPPRDAAGSVDGLIGRDLGSSPWSGGAFREDAGALGAEVGADILDELLDETVFDVLLNVGDV